MFNKFQNFILVILLFYQTSLYSKSTGFDNFNSKNLSNYFSGIVAFENENNTDALKFFNSSKVLINQHDPYFKRYINSLVLEKKVSNAINVIRSNKDNKNLNFFDAYLLLILDDLKKNNIEKALQNLDRAAKLEIQDSFSKIIIQTLKQYILVFKEKRIFNENKNLGSLSLINEAFQRCYLNDPKTQIYFTNLINKQDVDYSRYIYFYISYLVDKNKITEIKKILSDIYYINSTLLLSQGKSWIEKNNFDKFKKVFSCRNHNHIIGEFLFLISNLYSSEEDYERSNFYLYLSNFSNSKFVFNLSLLAENYYFIEDYDKSKKILKNFTKDNEQYFWYRKKKEAQIISKQKSKSDSLRYITSEFEKISKPNNKMILDIGNFYKNTKDYETAIKFYSEVIKNFNGDSQIKSDLLYRRGGSYERLGDYVNADKDLLNSLTINPDDAYVLNYLAYSWLERNYKIEEAIDMLEIAYAATDDDPYIIDSIGWAYYLTKNFVKAEKFLRRAVELMPDDPIVNDHYGDILWKLDQKIQARYFWNNVLKMKDLETEMIKKINNKLVYGPKNS